MADKTALIPDEIEEVEARLPAVQAPTTLFQTTDPTAVLERSTVVAERLARVIRDQHLYASIGGTNHVTVSGWTLCGSMLGIFPITIWTRKLENGFEARVEARTLQGNVVGAAEAECVRSERNWSNRESFALRSMAQTRATSKAMRMPLGFIIQLAGFNATPAEEMAFGGDSTPENPIPTPIRKKPTKSKPGPKPKKAKKKVDVRDHMTEGMVEEEVSANMKIMEDEYGMGEGPEDALLNAIAGNKTDVFGGEPPKPKKPQLPHGVTEDQLTCVYVKKWEIFKGIGKKSQKPFEVHKFDLHDPSTDTLLRSGTFDKKVWEVASSANPEIAYENGTPNDDPDQAEDGSLVWVALKFKPYRDSKGEERDAYDLLYMVSDADWRG